MVLYLYNRFFSTTQILQQFKINIGIKKGKIIILDEFCIISLKKCNSIDAVKRPYWCAQLS